MPLSIGIVASHVSLPVISITPSRLNYMPGDIVQWNVVSDKPSVTLLDSIYSYSGSSTGLWSSTATPPSQVSLTNGTGIITGTLEAITNRSDSTITAKIRQPLSSLILRESVPINVLSLPVGNQVARVTASSSYATLGGLTYDGRCHKFTFNVTAYTGYSSTVRLRVNGTIYVNFQVSSNPATNSGTYRRYLRVNPGDTVEWSFSTGGGIVSINVAKEDDPTFALTKPQ